MAEDRTDAPLQVLLLGAGYLGSELLWSLPAAHRVTVLDHGRNFERLAAAPGFDPARMRLVGGDLLDRETLDGLVRDADIVINLTGGGGNAAVLRDPRRYISTYVLGMEQLARSAERAGVDRVYLSSSVSVYPSPPPGQAVEVTEATPPAPSTPYGFLKLAAEQILLAAGPDSTILRLSHLYGSTALSPYPTEGLLGNLLSAISAGRPLWIDGDGTQALDYLHVRDACRCLALLVSRPGQGRQVYNVGTGGAMQVREIASVLAGLAAGRLGSAPAITFRPAKGGVVSYPAMSTDSIRRRTGWSPEISLAEGLGELLAASLGRRG